jgi:hypothetical protein
MRSLELAGIKALVLLIHGRDDRMVPFGVSIAILNHIADWHLVLLNNSTTSRCSRSRPNGPRGTRIPVRLLRGTAGVKAQSARLLGGSTQRDQPGFRGDFPAIRSK